MQEPLSEYMVKSGVKEFPFISVARQGYRTAVEILANAAILEGKQVYLGSHISGARSMAPHSITLRIANTTSIPTGVYATSPTGLFASSETLVTWTKSEFGTIGETGIVEAIGAFQKGLLMVCTSLPPEAIKYPLDFEGTVATADAAEIFRSKVAIDPPPYGIASLGLFLKATDDLVGLDTLAFITNGIYAEFKDPQYIPPVLLNKMIAAGWLGRKSGKGFYEYKK